ncbi:MAG: hypothetical protein BGO52_00265 [Sphingobacteriales bacterium 44-61]|nr:MAG: hypothetical protein BGO52_00265 [Sphingobacteriales bacterium 44-61]
MKEQESIQLTSEGYMPLTIERLTANIETGTGKGTLYSLCHYYEQNGDLMRDPEMCFIVVDNRSHPQEYEAIEIYPQLFRQDSSDQFDECIRIENNRVTSYIKVWQQGQCSVAAIWFKNLQQQGFLK